MKIFKLPDLGEGLPDAIIREWHIKPGDAVRKDQILVSVETAKALVDVPAPFDGVIEKCFADIDETIETGAPLIGFEGAAQNDTPQDTGTVVGKIEQSDTILNATSTTDVSKTQSTRVKATPAVRTLARQLQVDLTTITPKGERISVDEVKAAAKTSPAPTQQFTLDSSDWTPLSGLKKAMVMSMRQSHQNIVPVTLMDDADIHAWKGKQDITVRIIRAIIHACKIEPAANALFDGNAMRIQHQTDINLGLAVDMPHGLFVPVIKDAANKTDIELRETIQRFKQQAETKTIPQNDLHGASIVLSNFGAIAGKYANPIILSPTVAIIGIGRLHKAVVPDENNQPAVHRIMPISLTVDHRAVTGGEAARFLAGMIESLSKA